MAHILVDCLTDSAAVQCVASMLGLFVVAPVFLSFVSIIDAVAIVLCICTTMKVAVRPRKTLLDDAKDDVKSFGLSCHSFRTSGGSDRQTAI